MSSDFLFRLMKMTGSKKNKINLILSHLKPNFMFSSPTLRPLNTRDTLREKQA